MGANRVADPLPQGDEDNSETFSAIFGGKMHANLFTDVDAEANLADVTLV